MMTTTEEYLAALTSGAHTIVGRARFRLDDEYIDADVISGDTKEDRTATWRRSCDLIVDGSNIPMPGRDYDDSPLWPVGNEVQIWAGLELSDGTAIEFPQGLFRISRPRITHTNEGLEVSIQGYDRGRAMSRNKFTRTYVIAEGQDFATELKRLLQDRLPYLDDEDFEFMVTDGSDGGFPITTPRLVYTSQDDPWVKALEMAESFGAELLFDGVGHPVLRPQPDPQYTPASYVYTSGDQALLETITRDLDDEEAYNGVIVTGQNTNNVSHIPRGEAWDLDEDSPTYYNPADPDASRYGAVVLPITSDYVTSDEQAAAFAQARLLAVTGVLESVEFDGIPNYAQECSDVIRVEDPESGVNSNYIIDSLTKGLGPEGTMSGTTRKRRVTNGG